VQHRLPLGLVIHSPLDQIASDMFLAFPGSASGNTTEVMTHVLFNEVISRAEFLIDMHTPTTGGRYVPFAFPPPLSLGAVAERASELARAFGVNMILHAEEGLYIDPRTPHVYGASRGIIGLGIEMGEGSRYEESLVQRGVEGLTNVLRSLEMLPGNPRDTAKPILLRSMTLVRSRRGGLLQQKVDLGQRVATGEVLAEVVSPYGDTLEEVRSPHGGLLTRLTTFPVVWTGDRIAQIGVEVPGQTGPRGWRKSDESS
jgi:predicted deacylase